MPEWSWYWVVEPIPKVTPWPMIYGWTGETALAEANRLACEVDAMLVERDRGLARWEDDGGAMWDVHGGRGA